jgi:hypothetical protein
MQSEKRCSPRVVATVRIAIDAPSPEDAGQLTVGELESIVSTIRELAAGYELLSRERAEGRRDKR